MKKNKKLSSSIWIWPVAEEYIEYYADKYKKLTREHKFAIPLCKHTNKDEIYNAIEATSNIPAGYYITAECTRDVEKFAQNLHGKFGHKDGPFYADKVAIKIFLHDLEHFLTDIYHTHFFFFRMIDHFNVNFS